MAQKEIAMLFDSSRCTGCKGCQVACKQWNMLPSPMGLNENVFHGSYQNPPNLNGDTRLVMTFDEKPSGNKYHPIAWAIGRRSCYHCTDAGCVQACSSGALYKTEQGVVAFDTEKCNGCTFCQAACPFACRASVRRTAASTSAPCVSTVSRKARSRLASRPVSPKRSSSGRARK